MPVLELKVNKGSREVSNRVRFEEPASNLNIAVEPRGTTSNSTRLRDASHDNLLWPKSHQLKSDTTSPTSSSKSSQTLKFYPAYCHSASPTWFIWVKLTIYAIYNALTIRDDYHHSLATQFRKFRNEPRVCFYLNHPIQFVQIVGVVTVFEIYFEKFWLFTVDDSTGATIDVVCRKTNKEVKDDRGEEEKDEELEIQQLSDSVQQNVDIGVVVQVKGLITLYQRDRKTAISNNFKNAAYGSEGQRIAAEAHAERGTRQITLSRLSVVRDTMQELALIAARTKFHGDVLDAPWVLSQEQQRKLREHAIGEYDQDRARTKKRKNRDAQKELQELKDQKEIERQYQAEEAEREAEAKLVRHAALRTEARAVKPAESSYEDRLTHVESTTFFAQDESASRTANEPKPDGSSARSIRKRKKKRKSVAASLQDVAHVPDKSLNESFGIDDDEKSALLRAAFGT